MRGLLCVAMLASLASGAVAASDSPDEIRLNLLEKFQNTDDYTNLAQEAHLARAALESASQRVVDHLAQTSQWKTAQEKVLAAQAALASARQKQADHPEDVAIAVTNLMSARETMRQIVAEALNNDQDVVHARQQLVEVLARLSNLRKGFELTLQKDPQWLAARHEQVQDLVQTAVSSDTLKN